MIQKSRVFMGGGDEERLFLISHKFDSVSGQKVFVSKTNIVGSDMRNTIARHKARYYQVGFFCRPGMRVLDFPCGSGYAAEILDPFEVKYEGFDVDCLTIEYAQEVYGDSERVFGFGDLQKPVLDEAAYDVIACIEGLEHIELTYQASLIASFWAALKPGGTLVVSSPERRSGKSGPSEDNPYHLGELTRADFVGLLHEHFGKEGVEIVSQRSRLTTGFVNNCLYGICHKQI